MTSLLLLIFLLQATALPINITRLTTHLTTLATHNDLPPPSVQRILYTPADISSRTYLKSIFKQEGLTIHEDSLGNIFATWYPSRAPGILTGSHFDAIPNSGMYDGTLGVLSALEAITSLKESGFVPKRSITILAFTSEEPTRFGLSCIGSRVLSGTLPPQNLSSLTDMQGIPFHAARATAGYTGDVTKVPLKKGAFAAFVELHSEQGPLLESSHTDIGAVTSIAAPAAMSVSFKGPGGHAGTTLMQERRDPSLAAAELALVVEAAARKFGSTDTVATNGYISITPNAINSVPTEAKLGIDVRDINEQRRDKVLDVIESAAHIISKKRGVAVEVVVNSRDPPAGCDNRVIEAVTSVAKEHGMKVKKMVSRAYHDALFMARVMPTGMIFVPCRGGISHRPDEFVAQRDIENGVKVLAGVLKRLAGDARKRNGSGYNVNYTGFIEESHEKVEEILDSVRKQTADVEDSATDDEGEEFAESQEFVEAAKRKNSRSGDRRRVRSSGRTIRRSRGPTAARVGRPRTRDSEENGRKAAGDRQNARLSDSRAKRVEAGSQMTGTSRDREIAASAKPKAGQPRKADATNVDEPDLQESHEENIGEAADPNITCTCTASNHGKAKEAGKKLGKSEDREIAVSAKPNVRRSNRLEDSQLHNPSISESDETEIMNTGGRKESDGDAEHTRSTNKQAGESNHGRRVKSTQRESGVSKKSQVTKNGKPTVADTGEKGAGRGRVRKGTQSSETRKNNFVDNDEL